MSDNRVKQVTHDERGKEADEKRSNYQKDPKTKDREIPEALISALYRRGRQKVNESLRTTEGSDQQDELID